MYFNFANYQLGSGIDKSEISNNMIGGIFYSTNPYGMYITSGGCRNINFYHNSISIMNAGFGYAFQMQYSTSGYYGGLVFKNNSFVVYNGSQYAGYFYWQTSGMIPAQPIDSFKNNNIWNSNTGSSQAVFGQNGYGTNGWISPSTNGLNTSTCLWVDPLYINPSTNLHTISGALSNNGTNIATITTDIDGDTRPLSPSSTVDIGADEFNVPAENIGAFAIISPTLPLVTGLQDVIVQIKNFGSATITSANVNYKVGLNGSTKTIAWTGSIATNATSNVTFTGANQYNFTLEHSIPLSLGLMLHMDCLMAI
ncbi:MAG: hypothetical protein IPK03_09100 [Bacteroidetes bacterium]|nr:hypothetical protein [Bacteroidota bacterium]